MSKQSNFECFTNQKNISIYRDFGRNHLIKSITGSDETVHREPLFPSVGSLIERSDEATCSRVIKCLETIAIGSWSDASDAFLRDLISTVITLVINGRDYMWSGVPWLKPRVHLILSENHRPRFACAIGPPTRCHVASSSWSLIATDRTALITLTRRDHEVVDFIRSRVKNNTELTHLGN